MATRAKNFPVPHKMSERDFKEICESNHFPYGEWPHLRRFFDGLVDEFGPPIREDRDAPTSEDDRTRLTNARDAINTAAYWLSRRHGPVGQYGLVAVAPIIGEMISEQWLHDKFPGDGLAPRPRLRAASGARRALRTPMRAKQADDEFSPHTAELFVRFRAAKVLPVILGDIEAALNAAILRAVQRPGAKGGRAPLGWRRVVIVNLADVWSRLGKPIKKSKKSEFVQFVESVFVAIGWPTSGIVDAAIEGAKEWENQRELSR